jgi:hypothetical protein
LGQIRHATPHGVWNGVDSWEGSDFTVSLWQGGARREKLPPTTKARAAQNRFIPDFIHEQISYVCTVPEFEDRHTTATRNTMENVR